MESQPTGVAGDGEAFGDAIIAEGAEGVDGVQGGRRLRVVKSKESLADPRPSGSGLARLAP